MDIQNKTTRLWGNFFKVNMVQIRTFHMTWFAFFTAFFAWFGIAPLMIVVREDLQLTKDQVGWTIIAGVAATIFARFLVGWMCDRFGPRLTYTWLLTLSAFPVAGIAFADSFESFLFFRLLISLIGGSFVITQYHTTMMFAPNVIGTANATSAGWGNLGGGVTQLAMPLLFSGFIVVFGFTDGQAWRASMVFVGAVVFLVGILYYFMTQDAPDGNFKDLRARGEMPATKEVSGQYWLAMRDYRVWILFLIYAVCFGIEIATNSVLALYFFDYFQVDLITAGAIAASFGLMNIFARTLGGIFGDNFGAIWGLKGRTFWLFVVILLEGLALMLFSRMNVLFLAIPMLILFSLFVQMAEGATYSVVPFVNKKALGAVVGVVGAGGNAGAVAVAFLFKGDILWNDVFLIVGAVVTVASVLALFIRFSPEQEAEEKALFEKSNLELLEIRATRANEELARSAKVISDYNKKNGTNL
ncbi:MAG: MFS transporter [Rhodobacteraceae bacterium]|nr:MFS transporter [Paracoccaceae bacterium]